MTEDNKNLNRTPRSADTRANKEARKVWSPPSRLDAPAAPEGYTHRWIRAETLGVEDRSNISDRLSEGFELVRSEEISAEDLKKYTVMDEGQHAGVVKRGGLLLARIPNETREERNSYFAARAQTQQDAVDNDLMKESDPNSPILKPRRESKTTFGGGQRS
tara:strand:+ start:1442 stop:1924 length:483 start_codon:yes stop_codon:yes gene_type:complete